MSCILRQEQNSRQLALNARMLVLHDATMMPPNHSSCLLPITGELECVSRSGIGKYCFFPHQLHQHLVGCDFHFLHRLVVACRD